MKMYIFIVCLGPCNADNVYLRGQRRLLWPTGKIKRERQTCREKVEKSREIPRRGLERGYKKRQRQKWGWGLVIWGRGWGGTNLKRGIGSLH